MAHLFKSGGYQQKYPHFLRKCEYIKFKLRLHPSMFLAPYTTIMWNTSAPVKNGVKIDLKVSIQTNL